MSLSIIGDSDEDDFGLPKQRNRNLIIVKNAVKS